MGEKTIILKENKKSKSALAKARSDKKAQQIKDEVSLTEWIIEQQTFFFNLANLANPSKIIEYV